MNILEQIKQAFNNIKNRFFNGNKKIEAPAPMEGNTVIEQVGNKENVAEGEKSFDLEKLVHVPLGNEPIAVPNFCDLDPKTIEDLMNEQIGKESIGWTYKEKPTVSGEINGEKFVGVEPKKQGDGTFGLTICNEKGRFEITRNLKGEYGQYEEEDRKDDGTQTHFYARLDIPEAQSSTCRDGTTLINRIEATGFFGEPEFVDYAQPSNEDEYSQVTGLPVFKRGYGNDLSTSEVFGGSREKPAAPCYVTIEAKREITQEEMDNGIVKPYKKAIKYVFTNVQSYLNGEKPYMIYMDGIGGRNGASGMFRRLEGDTYVDNSTFKREENGEYSIQTISYDEIMALAGKMPTQVSDERINSVAAGEFKIPVGIQAIYNQAKTKAIDDKNRGEEQKVECK